MVATLDDVVLELKQIKALTAGLYVFPEKAEIEKNKGKSEPKP